MRLLASWADPLSNPKAFLFRSPSREFGRNAAEVWSGRGLRPGWVKAALRNGYALDDLSIR